MCLWHSRERKRGTRRLRTTGWGVIGLPHRTHQLHEDRASPPILENGYGTRHTSNVFESEVGRRSVRLQAVHDQEPDYWTIGLEPVLNDRTRRWSANVQQHRVDGNEIFSIPIRISSTSDVKDEILQRISEIRMQITQNVDEWLVIHQGAVPGSDHHSEQLGHQHTISAYGGWHPKLVEPHPGQGGIYH